jgi:Helicase HerA, central domain/TraM recognition site of TraD and TraG
MPYRWDDDPPGSSWELQEDPETHWNRRLKEARGEGESQPVPGSILLGTNSAGRQITISPETLRTHMHVIGATGVGKSFFLEGIIKNLILEGQGVCLIDPHGDLYHRVLDFCAYANRFCPELRLQNRVIPFDIAETRHLLGFNPVARNARVEIYQVVALMEAVRKCWGQGSFQETPRLARWLFNTIYAVVNSETTFLQTYHMVNPQPNPYRQAITRHIKNPRVRAEWEHLSRIKSDERREERVESCLNRIRPFVEHDVIRHIVGQYTNTINFHDVLVGNKILLVNLARQNVISDDDRHLLGTLLVNELITAAFARREKERTPYYLFIDEFQHFVTKDICEILDGGRKFGLHLVLAHQHLSQLKEKDPEVYFSTLTNARTKVVFGGLIDQDLDILAKELYVGELNPDEVKNEIWQTKFRPVETTRVIVAESESHGESSATAEVSHQSIAEGATYIPNSLAWSGIEFSDPASASTSEGSSSSSSTSESRSDSRSRSVTEVPWYEQHEFKELSSVSFRSLEEQLYKKKAQMKRQGTQHAAILIPDSHVELVKAPTLEDLIITDSLREEFKQACFAASGCFKLPEEAEREVREMDERLILGGAEEQRHTAANDEDLFD